MTFGVKQAAPSPGRDRSRLTISQYLSIVSSLTMDTPPIDRDEVYKEIFEQAENFKKHQVQSNG